jgi:hypothetical protein
VENEKQIRTVPEVETDILSTSDRLHYLRKNAKTKAQLKEKAYLEWRLEHPIQKKITIYR